MGIALTLYITVYLTASIINVLRNNEQDLERVNRLLKDQGRIKSQYIYRVSHDIRGSLSAIQGCLGVVLRGPDHSLTGRDLDMIERAEARSAGLNQYVNDLLFLSFIRSGEVFDSDIIPICDLIDEVLSSFDDTIKKKNLNVVKDCQRECVLKSNRELLTQLFSHLIGNAVKYTLPSGLIAVTLRSVSPQPSISVSVSDNGIGIPEVDIERVFEDFYRSANAKTLDSAGTGLGLPIARAVVEWHRGTLKVDSKEGVSSTFMVILPEWKPRQSVNGLEIK